MNRPGYTRYWTGLGLAIVVGLAAGAVYLASGRSAPPVARASEGGGKSAGVPVSTVHPTKGIKRISNQSGSIQAYESVKLYAKVPGFLKTQNVDIGDPVKSGQILAVLNVPELETQLKRGEAVLAQAKSRVIQMKARVKSVTAEHEASKAAETQAEATAKSSSAWVRYRKKQLTRMIELFNLKSIDERLVDESTERFEASVETERSSKAAILTSKAQISAFAAKVESAQADVAFAEAELDVAQADLDKFKVQLGFATITAPFDGVITHRSLSPGEFVRSANEGGGHEPILIVQRTDLMRVIVHVPDRDVPFVDPGDEAIVEIDAFSHRKLQAKISRFARTEDVNTRLMRVEIDLPNPTGKICHGMYGKVSLILDKQPKIYTIPSACLVGDAENGVGEVFVIREHKAHLQKIQLGIDDGVRVAVLEGLAAEDDVIIQPSSELAEGALVAETTAKGGSGKSN